MRSGYNPLRRNRNIGTSKQGHGRNNALTIPLVCHADRIWWENLGAHNVLHRKIGSLEFVFVIEQVREDCTHACTVGDVCHLLSLVPPLDLESLQTFVFRQSTRKQWSVSPAWGRLAYTAELGFVGQEAQYRGPTIFLEAINPQAEWKWNRSLGPSDALEIARLREDGHRVVDTGKEFVFYSSLQSVRATQLYRTLPHEIGHWVDWLEKVERPAAKSPFAFDALSNKYFAKSEQEREQFAHRYAEALREQLIAARKIPFDRIDDPT